jgi:hypothetical protein
MSGRRPNRTIPLTLPPEQWDRLVKASLAASRDPSQHARWLVLRALEADAPEPAPTSGSRDREVA